MSAFRLYDLWISIASGLITAILIWIWSKFFRKVNDMATGIIAGKHHFSVEGRWTNKLKSASELSDVTMLLSQSGTRVTGTMTIDLEMYSKEGTQERTYTCTVTGENRSGFIILQGLSVDKDTPAFNCGIFVVKDVGKTLEGSAIRIHNRTSMVFIDKKVVWEKKSSW